MFKRYLKTSILFFSLTLLVACSSYLYKHGNIELYKTSFSEFQETGASISEKYNVKLDSNNRYLLIESYVKHAPGKMTYLYAFRNDTLLYFGYPYQFSQSSDETVNALGKHFNTLPLD